ncbi:MAG: Uma2 family endonuclease [Gemmataceae bacterium]|nr:Uma2 family endonuclease [Gemmataceae bacterium]
MRSAETSSGVVLDDISWDDYQTIGAILRDRPALRLTYDGGSMEIMTTSPEHEKYKMRLGRLVETLAEEFDLKLEPGGNMTFQREDLVKGLEADQCYWIQHEAEVRGKLVWDPVADPPPDLVIEIEISRSAMGRMSIYAALRVPEVWCFDGERLRVFVLQSDGVYAIAERSPAFPSVDMKELARFLQPAPEQDYLSLIRSFRAWAQDHRRHSPKKEAIR